MSIKEQLHYLLNEYWNKRYDTSVFCDQFTLICNMELCDLEISKQEKEYMEEICRQAERYTSFEEDLTLSSFFLSEADFREKFEGLYKKWQDCLNR